MALRKVRQAVVLAGGFGRRMLPLTSDLPKPMIPVAGAPFIQWLGTWLVRQGVKRMTLLAGWKADRLTGYFQTHPIPGLEIDFVIDPPEVETTLRLKSGFAVLDREFLMLYGDNFCPLALEQAEAQWLEGSLPAQLTIYDNADGYSRSNTDWADGRLTAYDHSRSEPGLRGVEIGFTFMRRELIGALPHRNQSIGEVLFPQLARGGKAGVFLTRHHYFGPANPARLRLAEEYFALPPTAALKIEDVMNPGIAECVLTFLRKGWRVIVLDSRQRDLPVSGGAEIRKLEHLGVRFLAGSFSSLAEAGREIRLNPLTTTFLSSRPADALFAERLGCGFAELISSGPLIPLASCLADTRPRDKRKAANGAIV